MIAHYATGVYGEYGPSASSIILYLHAGMSMGTADTSGTSGVHWATGSLDTLLRMYDVTRDSILAESQLLLLILRFFNPESSWYSST